MKKEDLKNDPLREKLVGALSFLGKNKNVSATVFLIIIVIMAFVVSSSESTFKEDYSVCFDTNKASNIEEYCQQETIKNALLEIEKDKGSNQNLLLLLKGFSSTPHNERLDYFNKIEFENIKPTDLRSMLYKVYGDILFDENKNSEAIEKYKSALSDLDNKRTYSALLNYKIARVYEANKEYSKANDFLTKALDCRLGDGALEISRDIDRLRASVAQAIK